MQKYPHQQPGYWPCTPFTCGGMVVCRLPPPNHLRPIKYPFSQFHYPNGMLAASIGCCTKQHPLGRPYGWPDKEWAVLCRKLCTNISLQSPQVWMASTFCVWNIEELSLCIRRNWLCRLFGRTLFFTEAKNWHPLWCRAKLAEDFQVRRSQGADAWDGCKDNLILYQHRNTHLSGHPPPGIHHPDLQHHFWHYSITAHCNKTHMLEHRRIVASLMITYSLPNCGKMGAKQKEPNSPQPNC